jgi:DNA topoisomerase I
MGKALVIVESPAKARTISKFLGSEFVVEASIGHIRDLPKKSKDIPSEFASKKWAKIGVDIENDFTPLYVVDNNKKDHVKHLKKLVKESSTVYIATDEDREGESIAWHLVQVLKPKVPVRRLVFHEITKKALDKAMENVGSVNENMVQAQEVRRVVDRLVGYKVSPLLWEKLRDRTLSAGRVQSAALRLTVERERERLKFLSADWWSLHAKLTAQQKPFDIRLHGWDGKTIADGQSFNDSGKLTKQHLVLTEKTVGDIVKAITNTNVLVATKKTTKFTERPKPPFITSSLQQEAIRKLKWTAKRTMSVAQRLYENGWITYMRTDSTTLSSQALQAARTLIAGNYGSEFVPAKPRIYATTTTGAQEAHEAIRPAGEKFKTLKEAKLELELSEMKLYELIWKRTVASQMNDAKGERLRATFTTKKAEFVATGKTYLFQGFRLAYVEGAVDEESALAEKEKVLPHFEVGDSLPISDLVPAGHSTKPPARFTEASLVSVLEKKGIGRPSTYASIIENILSKNYVFKKGTAMVPSFKGFIIIQLLEKYMEWLVDYSFTAQMETQLDKIAQGKMDRSTCLRNFYFGDTGLENTILSAEKVIEAGSEYYDLVSGDKALQIAFNRHGEFIRYEEELVYLNESIPPDEMTIEKAFDIIAEKKKGPQKLGVHPEFKKDVFLKKGPFGHYIQLGPDANKEEKIPKPKQASLLRGMTPETITFDIALQLLELPKVMGTITVKGKEENIRLSNGRFGPFITVAKTNVSVPRGTNPLEMTLEDAKVLFEEGSKGKSGELKKLGKDKEGKEVVVKSGRYGPYVTNGKTNASLGKANTVEDITIERALELLEIAKNKPKKARRKKKKS